MKHLKKTALPLIMAGVTALCAATASADSVAAFEKDPFSVSSYIKDGLCNMTENGIEFYDNRGEAAIVTEAADTPELYSDLNYYEGEIDFDRGESVSVDGSLSGVVIGAGGWAVDTINYYENAFDGDENTYYEAYASSPECWTGIGVENPTILTEVRFLPVQGEDPERLTSMEGGHIQGSNDLMSWTTLYSYTSEDYPEAGEWIVTEIDTEEAFLYFRYVNEGLGTCDVAELRFFGQMLLSEPMPMDWGACGDNVEWTLYDNGAMVIFGEGDMWNWTEEEVAPWQELYQDTITSVVIEEGVTSVGDYAFFYCWDLNDVTIPEGVVRIGDYAFSETWLFSVDFPDSMDEIGKCAFYGSGLEELFIPAGVTVMGEGAVVGCMYLTDIAVDEANPNYTSKNGVLYNKEMTVLLAYPAGREDTSYAVPGGVTTIGAGAFSSTMALSSIVLPNSLREIGDFAFEFCYSLYNIDLGYGVTAIGDGAFHFCESLPYIYLPASVEEIGKCAFLGCTALENIAVNCGNNTFTVSDNVLFTKDRSVLVLYCPAKHVEYFRIPESVTEIADAAFYGASNLQAVTITDGVVSIGEGAFMGCTSLIEVELSENLESIGNSAFSMCESLTEVIIPDSVAEIGEEAFVSTAITEITVPNGVTVLADAVFAMCTNLESVTLPDGLTEIGTYAFAYCTALTKITIPESVTTLGDGAFALTGLIRITVPGGIETVPMLTFAACADLKEVTISQGVKEIGVNAFAVCVDLDTVVLPESVSLVDSGAFSLCEDLCDITVLSIKAEIAADAFDELSKEVVFRGYDDSTVALWADANGYTFASLGKLGDITADGSVDIADALRLFQYSMNSHNYPIEYVGNIDFNYDSSVDISDALRLFQYSMNEESYPLQ